jgi:hypothetical protein
LLLLRQVAFALNFLISNVKINNIYFREEEMLKNMEFLNLHLPLLQTEGPKMLERALVRVWGLLSNPAQPLIHQQEKIKAQSNVYWIEL